MTPAQDGTPPARPGRSGAIALSLHGARLAPAAGGVHRTMVRGVLQSAAFRKPDAYVPGRQVSLSR